MIQYDKTISNNTDNKIYENDSDESKEFLNKKYHCKNYLNSILELIQRDKLFSNWTLYYHNDSNNWNQDSYNYIMNINSPSEFWKFYNYWCVINSASVFSGNYFFLMRDNILPVWENPNNINGGCWSIKVLRDKINKTWEDISLYTVCEILCPEISSTIIGVSICLKKNGYGIIKIWKTNSQYNSLKLINKTILNKYGSNIIYIAHINES